jgi:ion channel-forming bestrophin family protein
MNHQSSLTTGPVPADSTSFALSGIIKRLCTLSVKRKLALWLLLVGLYAGLVDWLDNTQAKLIVQASGAAYGSFILGVLLVFRTNSAYDRWWEARKLWGQLTNETRNICIKVDAFSRSDSTTLLQFARLLIAFPYALKEHLRSGCKLSQVPGFQNATKSPRHVPFYIADQIYKHALDLRRSRDINTVEQLQLDAHIQEFMDICGKCERIRNSPVALSYRQILRHGIGLNIIGLPWYLAPDFHFWTIPIVMTAGYFMIGLELIAEDIEEPFGHGDDNLPLEHYCKTIEESVIDMVEQHEPGSFIVSASTDFPYDQLEMVDYIQEKSISRMLGQANSRAEDIVLERESLIEKLRMLGDKSNN